MSKVNIVEDVTTYYIFVKKDRAKGIVTFCLFAMIFCFCDNPRKHHVADETTVGDSFKVSTNGVPELLLNRNDTIKTTVDNSPEVLVDDDLGMSSSDVSNLLADEDADVERRWEPGWAAGKYAKWKAIVDDTIPSMVRRALDSVDDETIVAISAIMKKEAATLEEIYSFTGIEANEEVCVNAVFDIMYNDDNYITARFGGDVVHEFSSSIAFIWWPIVIDIKNKKKMALGDIVIIDDLFVKVVFKKLESIFHEELNVDLNDFYTLEKLKYYLLKADVFENEYAPDVISIFDAKKLSICFSVIAHWGQFRCISLPLNEIRSMIILPNLPIDSQQHK